ncbi:MAG: 7-cyano-7-deazaguanine reductase [Verrucomicrobiales bacterium]|jgi:7-cyano-7-deazaguanine reductase
MSSAEPSNLTLLGNSQSGVPDAPSREILETFANHNAKRPFWIKLDCLEFSSLCPVTGQPDYAKIRIEYVPGKLCVETKSLKFYLAAYRSQAGFNEEIINRIADDLIAVCQPQKFTIEGAFGARGGIALTVEIQYPDEQLLEGGS